MSTILIDKGQYYTEDNLRSIYAIESEINDHFDNIKDIEKRICELACATPKDVTPAEDDPILYMHNTVQDNLDMYYDEVRDITRLNFYKDLIEEWKYKENNPIDVNSAAGFDKVVISEYDDIKVNDGDKRYENADQLKKEIEGSLSASTLYASDKDYWVVFYSNMIFKDRYGNFVFDTQKEAEKTFVKYATAAVNYNGILMNIMNDADYENNDMFKLVTTNLNSTDLELFLEELPKVIEEYKNNDSKNNVFPKYQGTMSYYKVVANIETALFKYIVDQAEFINIKFPHDTVQTR